MIGTLTSISNSPNQFKNLLDRHFLDVMYDLNVYNLDVQAYCLYPKFTIIIQIRFTEHLKIH